MTATSPRYTPTTITPHTIAKAENINSELTKIADAIDYEVNDSRVERAGKFPSWDVSGNRVFSNGTGSDAALRSDLALATGSNLTGRKASFPSAVLTSVGSTLSAQVSLLDWLTDAERADVLAGTNAIDITAKLTTALNEVHSLRPGAVIDATMFRNTWTWTGNPFAGMASCKVVLVTSNVRIERTFNDGEGIVFPSHFKWLSLARTVIAPDERVTVNGVAPGYGLLTTSTIGTQASGTSGTKTVTVASAVGINKGALLLLEGGQPDPGILHTLAAGVSAAGTSFTFNETITDIIGNSTIYIKIDSEIIAGTTNATTFTATERGAQGTTAAIHALNANVYVLGSFISIIESVAGTTLTIADNLPRTFVSNPAGVGAFDIGLNGYFEIDGEFDRTNVGGFFYCLSTPLARKFRTDGDVSLLRGNHGGVNLSCAQDCVINLDSIVGCGQPLADLGGDIWLYGACIRNQVNVRECRDGVAGWQIDNKSAGYGPYDGIGSKNIVNIGSLIDYTLEGQITASSENTVIIGYADTSVASVLLVDGEPGQGNVAVATQYNTIITRAQKTPRAPTGDVLGNNLISFNGSTGRRLFGAYTVPGGGITVPNNQPLEVTATVTGVKSGDKVNVMPAAILPGLTPIFGYAVAANTVRIIFSSAGALGPTNIAAAAVFNIEASGAW